MANNSEIKKAEALGRIAFRAGKQRYQNPYNSNLTLQEAWWRGYDQ